MQQHIYKNFTDCATDKNSFDAKCIMRLLLHRLIYMMYSLCASIYSTSLGFLHTNYQYIYDVYVFLLSLAGDSKVHVHPMQTYAKNEITGLRIMSAWGDPFRSLRQGLGP